MTPKISIIVPCYKQAQYLNDCLISISEQTYQNWECIIVNDGSPDNTEEVAFLWVEKDNRIKYLYQNNNGVCNARNNGIKLAAGEFILPLDADDKIDKNYVQDCLNAIIDKNEVKVAYGLVKNFGITSKVNLPTIFNFQVLIFSNHIHCSGIFRKTDWLRIGGYDENMVHGYEDWEFWINLLKTGGQATEIESTYLLYRTKQNSRMTGIDLKKGYNLRAYIIFKHKELYVNYLDDISRKININFSYAYYLSAKKYSNGFDSQFINSAKKQFIIRLNIILKSCTFIERKKILFNWYRKGKLNLTFIDVLKF